MQHLRGLFARFSPRKPRFNLRHYMWTLSWTK